MNGNFLFLISFFFSFFIDRGQKSCQKTQTGPWTDTWSHNATSMGSVMSGLQLIERWFVADASDDILSKRERNEKQERERERERSGKTNNKH